jgi:PAS domain S-box-containing protein
MFDAIAGWLFDPSGLTAHGFCLLWRPSLIWMHAVSDGIIGLAYFTIPLALVVVAQRRRDLVFRPVFGLFAAFILLCGTGHWFDLLTLWMPLYGVSGLIKAMTACTSVVTAIALWLLLPKVLAIPSAAQLRQANVALQETNRQMRMAGQLAGVGYWRLTLPSRTLQWSDEMFRIFGLDPAATAPSAEAITAVFQPEDRAEMALNVERAIANGRGYTEQVHLRRPSGELRRVHARGRRERDPNGVVTAIYGVLVDVTEQYQAEEIQQRLHDVSVRARHEAEASNISLQQLAQRLEVARERAEQASHAKSRFLASMSHELRTPLHGILGYAELLHLEGGLAAKQSARVDAMMGAGTHLLQMINSLLDLTEIESGLVELQVADIELREFATTCLDLVRPVAEAKHLGLSLIVAPGLPLQISTDAKRLRQVLLNLLGNAAKFTTEGSIELRLFLMADKTRLRIDVSDTGPGISAGQRHLLFEDFERLGANATAAVEGPGLGLALSTRLAALMGGRLGHEDRSGGGSVFWLELPLLAGQGTEPIMQADDDASDLRGEPEWPLHVLVVDDVAMSRDIARSYLCAVGHTVVCAEGGEEAVAAAAATDFDVVLMDVRMPGMNGLEATRRIRALAGTRGQVPVLAMTAQAFSHQVKECRDAGMVGHVAKPFTLNSLLGAVIRAAKPGRPPAGSVKRARSFRKSG